MSSASNIEWTDATWNPARGCSRVSPGCENCYAEKMAARFSAPGQPFHGFALRSPARWTRKVELEPEKLDLPLRWKKPRRIFVNSMSDLFHGSLSNEDIAAVFGVMTACPQHTFQVLTKRAARLPEWFASRWAQDVDLCTDAAMRLMGPSAPPAISGALAHASFTKAWPLPNVWIGVSVEDQERADERIPHLLKTPAAVRFLSCEPLIGPLSFRWARWVTPPAPGGSWGHLDGLRGIHWVIAGGESGPDARPCALEWLENIVVECGAAKVPVFVKQLGAYVVSEARTAPVHLMPGKPEDYRGAHLAPNGEVWAWRMSTDDRKGGDPSEWPENLRIRQFPNPETRRNP